jgi:hypothetical protein
MGMGVNAGKGSRIPANLKRPSRGCCFRRSVRRRALPELLLGKASFWRTPQPPYRMAAPQPVAPPPPLVLVQKRRRRSPRRGLKLLVSSGRGRLLKRSRQSRKNRTRGCVPIETGKAFRKSGFALNRFLQNPFPLSYLRDSEWRLCAIVSPRERPGVRAPGLVVINRPKEDESSNCSRS